MSRPESLPKLVFIPGADCAVFQDYPKTCAALSAAGFAVTAISPNWEEKRFANLAEQVTQAMTPHIGSTAVILAHSRGANVVMPALAQHPRSAVILASPSMTCREGYENSTTQHLVEERFPGQESQVRNVGMFALAQASKIPPSRAAVLVGGQEAETYPFMYNIAQATAQGFGVEPHCVPEAPHFIDRHESYIDAVVAEAHRVHAVL